MIPEYPDFDAFAPGTIDGKPASDGFAGRFSYNNQVIHEIAATTQRFQQSRNDTFWRDVRAKLYTETQKKQLDIFSQPS